MVTMDASVSIAVRWKDSNGICPSPEEIVEALQDTGKRETAKRKGKEVTHHECPQLEKLSAKLHTNTRKHLNPEGLTKNVSRGKWPLCREIALSRRHVDVVETGPFFHPLGVGEKVHCIENCPTRCDLEQPHC